MSSVEQVKIPEGYKQTDIGVIPEDWDAKKMGEGIFLFSGHHVLAQYCNLNGEGFPYITGPSDFSSGVISITKFTTKPTTICNENDILITVKGSGAGSLVESNSEYCISRQLMAIRVTDWNSKFLMFSILQNASSIKNAATGLIPGLSRADILEQVIPIPRDIKEQTIIANALSDVDNLITSLETLIAKKSAIKTAAMQQLLTGKKRLPGFEKLGTNQGEKQDCDHLADNNSTNETTQINASLTKGTGQTAPRPGYKQTELGETNSPGTNLDASIGGPQGGGMDSRRIPEDWEVDNIDNVLSITTGSKNTQDRISDGTYPFYVRSQTVERINSYSFDGEGVLTAGDGVGTGKIFHYINGKCDIHQRVYLMHNFSNRLHGYYFYIYFKNNFYDKVMSMTAKSSVDSVRREMIADMLITLPSIDEQIAISEVLSDMDTELDALQQRLSKTKKIKQGMMQELLTGKTRLLNVS